MNTDEMPKKAKCSVPRLAVLWQTSIAGPSGETEKKPLTPREFGQLKMLRNGLGDITWAVIDWALNNWWGFSQAAKACAGLPCAPAKPHIGFLLAHYDVAVNVMYSLAQTTNSVTAAEFIKKVDRNVYDQLKESAVDACGGNPELLAMVETAKTRDEMRTLLGQLIQ